MIIMTHLYLMPVMISVSGLDMGCTYMEGNMKLSAGQAAKIYDS